MATFQERANEALKYGITVIPVEANDKKTLIGALAATTDPAKIAEWNTQNTNYNTGLVAQARSGGVWILDCDSVEVAQKFKKDTGQTFPTTLTVQSSKAGHRYYKQNEASLKRLKNFSVTVDGKEFFSVRWNNEYCVGPLSVHPDGTIYKNVIDIEPVEAPDYVLDWLLEQYRIHESIPSSAPDDGGPILDGSRNSRLFKIGCKLREAGLNKEEIEAALLRINNERCKPPYDDAGVKVIAAQASKYEVGKDDTVLFSGRVGGAPVVTTIQPVEIPTIEYPVFPRWVMEGTSIYEGFVKPVCDVNSRYPEFMFMPAMALLLNYIGTRVRIEYSGFPLSWFMVLIGKRGEVIKSSSVQDAIGYFQAAGLADFALTDTKDSQGKSLVWQVGSPEGLGLDMQRTNCKNAVLFYDELSTLVQKSGIESSNLAGSLLSLYESGQFSNTVKRQSYSIQAGSYCASLFACCPTKMFNELWAQFASGKEGLDDRFFFLLEPETLSPLTKLITVPTNQNAHRTRQLVDKAVAQGVYRFATVAPLQRRIKDLGNRPEIRAEKLALAFAVDLGLSEIDEDCLERAIAIIEYEKKVKRYLGTSDAETKLAAAQLNVRKLLERSSNGRMERRDLKRKMNASRFGTEGWFRIYSGLLKANIICEQGSGNPGDPVFVQLLEIIEQE